MQKAAFFREILRDLSSGTSRIGVHSAVALVGLCVILLSDVITISGMVRQAEQYRESGAAVVVVSAPGRVDGTSCESLTEVVDVIAAGAMRHVDPVILTTLPTAPVEHYVITPRFARVLGASGEGSGVYASDDLAQHLAGDFVPIDGRHVDVAGTYRYPPDGRRAGFGWALLSPTPSNDGMFDECWVLAWPQKPDSRKLLLTTISPTNDASSEQPEFTQLNTGLGARFSGADEYDERPTGYATALAFLVADVLAGVSVWLRRVEIASNLHAGSSRRDLVLQLVLETAAWSFPAAAIAWAVGVFVAGATAPGELFALSGRSAQIASLFFAGSICGTIIGFTAVRESRLWAYVKER